VLDGGGKPLEEGKVAMLQKDLTALFTRFMSARLVRCQGTSSLAHLGDVNCYAPPVLVG
jgi:hypothetical protein